MRHIIPVEGGKPIMAWVPPADLESQALDQAENLARLPFLFKHLCLMPDAHGGYGMPIGGVAALDGYVSPAMVGMDIGCGMRAFRTNIQVKEFMQLREEVLDRIFATIPVGRNWHKDITHLAEFDELLMGRPVSPILEKEGDRIGLQLGTMGGNNHFIEAQVAQDDHIWFMLHSGSRNLGKKVCEHYDGIAKELNRKYCSSVPAEWQLAFLPFDSKEGKEYLGAMNFCLRFAYLNRQCMSDVIRDILRGMFPTYRTLIEVDVRHNYAAWENHFGKNVIVHRKGAVRATDMVIIPGCMETQSFIGVGQKNPASFSSCSHGAGRTMSRKAAVKQYSAQSIVERMKAKDISFRKPNITDIAEESLESYKDIESVMERQADLVSPTVQLRTIGVIKG
jgi:tRNA-splicing ligase RtcB